MVVEAVLPTTPSPVSSPHSIVKAVLRTPCPRQRHWIPQRTIAAAALLVKMTALRVLSAGTGSKISVDATSRTPTTATTTSPLEVILLAREKRPSSLRRIIPLVVLSSSSMPPVANSGSDPATTHPNVLTTTLPWTAADLLTLSKRMGPREDRTMGLRDSCGGVLQGRGGKKQGWVVWSGG